ENGAFATSITSLSIGLTATRTANYDYTLVATANGPTATISASALDPSSVKGYSGAVIISAPTGDAPSIICQTTGVQTTTTAPTVPTSATACPANMEILK
ncbi:MAG: type IV pilin-like G/H family protein, partial [Dolichospermum sp.]